MSDDLNSQRLDSSNAERRLPIGYLPMSGRQIYQIEATEKTDDMHEKDQLLGTAGTRDGGLEV